MEPEVTSSAFNTTTDDGSRLNITKYIPVGCLRVKRTNCSISSDYWLSCKTHWRALSNSNDDPSCHHAQWLSASFQENLLQEPDLVLARALHDVAWIRMEFKSIDQVWSVVRVYVLPDDVCRADINRDLPTLRKTLFALLNSLNLSRAAWNGLWSDKDQVVTISSPMNDNGTDEPSVFQLFNSLPSPNPQPEAIADAYIQEAMGRILENNVDGISSQLYMYQRRSAAMMLQRETAPEQILDPRLATLVDQLDNVWYCDNTMGTILREPRFYEAARGGICAETMGLGKTLICLAVILATKEIPSKVPDELLGHLPRRKTTGTLLQMAAANMGQTGTPWRHWLKRMELDGYNLSKIRHALEQIPGHYLIHPPVRRRVSRHPASRMPRKMLLSSTTIVVCPRNLLQQWLREIDKHTIEGSLNLLLMDDLKKDLPDAESLLTYDIILFSKPRFEYESRNEHVYDYGEYSGMYRRRFNKTPTKAADSYHSPLKDIHFKRLIIDEGHKFGNTGATKTEAVAVVDFLKLSARWIISGTPTPGLYGSEIPSIQNLKASNPLPKPSDAQSLCVGSSPLQSGKVLAPSNLSSVPNETSSPSQVETNHILERKDIEKLGNIATVFLKVKPWANSEGNQDTASWSQYAMQPRHGLKCRGNTDCLRATLKGMIIRHRPDDIVKDVTLPPLHHDYVYLEGSHQNKLSLNTFAMMIITNSVTSERKDADYFFHSRQRKYLQQLVSNLRESSFFWSGFATKDIQSTVDNAKDFLEKRKVPVTADDEALLKEVIKIGESVLNNKISQLISQTHEMPMYVENEWNEEVRKSWALDGESSNPTLMGVTLVHDTQKFVQFQLYKSNPMEGLVEAGTKAMQATFESQMLRPPIDPSSVRRGKPLKRPRPIELTPELAGTVNVGNENTSRKKSRSLTTVAIHPGPDSDLHAGAGQQTSEFAERISQGSNNAPSQVLIPLSLVQSLKSVLKQPLKRNITGTLPSDPALMSASIISTASVKLSYLMDRIVAHHDTEKIIVFYESENVAYYIAQALECLGIKHLIYAKSLHSSRLSKYIVTFNQTETFRVLLMDVSQAAFGLDISSASRVFFVNPVFSPQVEAQAVKRAHRIGQVKPVYVETLILKGSIEEVILERRKDLSEQEHQKFKSILDDQKIYDWIRNVRFLDIPIESPPGPEQMTALEKRQALFKAGLSACSHMDPDADLVGDPSPKKDWKGKQKRKVGFADEINGDIDMP